MSLIQIRDVPEHIFRKVSEGAKRERRSLAQHVVALLAIALDVEVDAKTRRCRLIEASVEQDSQRANQLTDPVQLLREDRRR